MVVSGKIMTQLPDKVQTQPRRRSRLRGQRRRIAKGKDMYSNVLSKESLRQKRGSTYRYAPYPERGEGRKT